MYKVLSVYQDGEIAGRCIKTFEELKTTVIKRINILKSGIVHEVVVLKDTKVLADQLKDYLVGFNYISFERKQNGERSVKNEYIIIRLLLWARIRTIYILQNTKIAFYRRKVLRIITGSKGFVWYYVG